jgi:Outer membrane lipoprotein carrier protein LolA-like
LGAANQRVEGLGVVRLTSSVRSLAFALLITGFSAAALAADWGLGPLLADIAKGNSGVARFAERKFVAALDTPVDSSGELVFIKPARLEKRTLKPRTETLILDGDDLIVDRNGTRRSFSLKQLPEAVAMVESLRATLAGDQVTLERVFTVALEGSAARWSLLLAPKSVPGARLLKEVRISGERGELNLIELDQTNGDRSVMRVLR